MSDYLNKRMASGARDVIPEPDILRNVTDLGTGQLTVTTIPQQLSSSTSSRRIATKITNLSAVEVWFGSTPGVNPASGDLLPAGRGQWVSIPAWSIIWVVTAAGTALISWAEAYE